MSDIFNDPLPRGVITLWFGAAAAVPSGWAICDGTNGTPDLRGRVAVGVDTTQTEFDVVGETGGATTHSLSVAELAVHTHTQNSHNHTQNAHNHTQNAHNHVHVHEPVGGTPNFVVDGSGGCFMDDVNLGCGPFNVVFNTTSDSTNATATNIATTAVNQAATAVNQNAGSGTAHNNLQPYMALHYMMKL